MTSQQGAQKKIHAEPTKDFFVNMITRDIALEDCIFDLLDNSIDGARRTIGKNAADRPFEGFEADISLNAASFTIEDNCGGIKLSDAIDYAFHFGRRRDQPKDVKQGIGLYGIGMKRAIFKLGRRAVVASEAEDACFTVTVDVDKWAASQDWDFEYEDAPPKGTKGTKISISPLLDPVSLELGTSGFQNQLIRLIARDYSFFVDKGLKVSVNAHQVPSLRYQLKQGDAIAPAVEEYEDDGVAVRIVAGLIDEIPEEIEDEYKPDKVDRFGWHVVCNDRVVLAGDKTDQTIWGVDDYRVWHPQYNGFGGFVFFVSDDQAKLPWTTTKRALDTTNPVYRRALQRMRVMTDEFVAYTNKRKENIPAAKAAEATATNVDVSKLVTPQPLKVPTVASPSNRVSYATVSYRRPVTDMQLVRRHLGDPTRSYKDIGEMTFEYYLKMELGK